MVSLWQEFGVTLHFALTKSQTGLLMLYFGFSERCSDPLSLSDQIFLAVQSEFGTLADVLSTVSMERSTFIR